MVLPGTRTNGEETGRNAEHQEYCSLADAENDQIVDLIHANTMLEVEAQFG